MSSGSLPSDDYLSGFINFIEKKGCALSPGNLWPITIPNSLHRMVSKLVSDQMQPFLATHIHPSQTAFINGRLVGCSSWRRSNRDHEGLLFSAECDILCQNSTTTIRNCLENLQSLHHRGKGSPSGMVLIVCIIQPRHRSHSRSS